MSWFRQYVTAFRANGTPSDGLFEKADGTVWLRNPDGSETQVGSGGSSQWGQESTAKYTYAGDPTGHVTPSAEGDLCVDTATPALYQATGDTSADWQAVAGGSIPDPVTEQFNIAPTDNTLDTLNTVTAPAGFGDNTEGDGDLWTLIDEQGNKLAHIDIYGDMYLTAPVGGNDFLFQIISRGDSSKVTLNTGTSAGIQILDSAGSAIFGAAGASAQINSAAIGFFGQAPTPQPTVPITIPSVQDVIDALVALGLVAQSD